MKRKLTLILASTLLLSVLIYGCGETKIVNQGKSTNSKEASNLEKGSMKIEEKTKSDSVPKDTKNNFNVKAQWAKDILKDFSSYDEFIVESTEPENKVVLSSENVIKNFKVLSLNYEDVDKDGKIFFSIKQLYTQKELTPQRPLVVGINFIGTIPNYGISYEDGEGNTKYYSIEISGKDGSLLLSEFSVSKD